MGPRWIATAVLIAATLAGCGGKSAAPTDTGRLSFDQGSAPLGYTDNGVVRRAGSVAVHDVSFLSQGRRVQGFLCVPDDGTSLPAVVFVHGSGGTRDDLLGDAMNLGLHGVVTLTITEPSSANPPATAASADVLLSESRDLVVSDVIAVRRAADVLQSLDNVDKHRLGYLGWSSGAKTGAFVAASDSRFGALALLSAGADTLDDFLAAAPASIRPKARIVLGSIDPLRYIALAKPGSVTLYDGSADEIVPRAALDNFVAAAPKGTIVHWYDGGHDLTAAAYQDAFAFLLEKLS